MRKRLVITYHRRGCGAPSIRNGIYQTLRSAISRLAFRSHHETPEHPGWEIGPLDPGEDEYVPYPVSSGGTHPGLRLQATWFTEDWEKELVSEMYCFPDLAEQPAKRGKPPRSHT